MNFFNPRVQKFLVEKSEVEKFIFEKSGVERSGVEMSFNRHILPAFETAKLSFFLYLSFLFVLQQRTIDIQKSILDIQTYFSDIVHVF